MIYLVKRYSWGAEYHDDWYDPDKSDEVIIGLHDEDARELADEILKELYNNGKINEIDSYFEIEK
jgi:hypothetical protein